MLVYLKSFLETDNFFLCLQVCKFKLKYFHSEEFTSIDNI